MRTILQDKFTGANGTALSAHSPDVGGPWTQVGAGLVLLNGKLTANDASAECTCPIGARVIDLSFDLDYNGMNDGSVTIWVENDGETNDYTWFNVKDDLTILLDAQKHGGFESLGYGYKTARSPGLNSIRVQVTPSRQIISNNGVIIWNTLRRVDPDVLLETLHLKIEVASGTYPLLDNLLVRGASF